MKFTDKVVIITGASSGIGEALALALASRGARLALAARREPELNRVVAACVERGAEAIAVPTDVADSEACAALVERTISEFGGVDCLVNNAGISMWARLDEVERLDIFERMMQVNYLGSVYCTYHALEALKRSGGLIVGISSLTGKTGVPTRSGYGASKHALQGFLDSLRIELRNEGVDVLVVSPGFVATDIRRKAFDGSGEARSQSPRDEGKGTMPLDTCVNQILRAMEGRRREVVMTLQAKVGMWFKLLFPSLIDGVAARAVGDPGRRSHEAG